MKCALYRHFDASGALLYVGASLAPITRQIGHRTASHWSSRISRIDLEWFDDADRAFAAEKSAIQSECPEFNCKHGARKRAAVLKKKGSFDNSVMIEAIRAHLDETGENETAFGRRVCGDYGLLSRLRNGHEPRSSTVEKINKAIAEARQ